MEEYTHRNQKIIRHQCSSIRGIMTRDWPGRRLRIYGPNDEGMIAEWDGRIKYWTVTDPRAGYISLDKARGLLERWRLLGEETREIPQGLAEALTGFDTLYLAGVPNRFGHLAFRGYVLPPGERPRHVSELLVDADVFPGHVMALFLECAAHEVVEFVQREMEASTGWAWKVVVL